MKEKLKKIYSLIVICMIFAFCSCQDDFDDNVTGAGNVKLSRVTLKDPNVLDNYKLMQEVQKIKSKQKSTIENGKMIYDSINDFYFDDENGILIESENGYKSYTFPIYRDEATEKLENIVFSLNTLNQYDAYIAEYILTDIEKEKISNEEFIDLSNVNQDVEITLASQKTTEVCWGVCSTPATYNPQGACTASYFYICQKPCKTGGSGGGSGTGTGSSSSGTGGSTSGTGTSGSSSGTGTSGTSSNTGSGTSGQNGALNNNGGILTTPVRGGGGTGSAALKDPCILLNKLKNDVGFKAKMAGLKNAAEQWGFEQCHTIYNSPTPNLTAGQISKFNYETFTGTASKPEVTNINERTNIQGKIHSHYAGLVSIFSPGDLQDLYEKMLYPEVTEDFFIGLITKKGVAYILQIQDNQAFLAFGNQYLSNKDKLRNFMENTYYRKYGIEADNPASTNEKAFLKMMSELGAGVSLASASFAPNTTTTPNLFNNWTKKAYDSDFDIVKPSNCY